MAPRAHRARRATGSGAGRGPLPGRPARYGPRASGPAGPGPSPSFAPKGLGRSGDGRWTAAPRRSEPQVHRWIISHFRGNVVGYMALFVALGGTSYAAVSLKPGSVRSRALAKGAVTHSKLAANSVDATNVING